MNRPRAPVVLALLVVALATSPVLVPGTVLVARDLQTFHLPLRLWFWSETVDLGRLPQWNPHLHHGQPTLSNPNYAAYYPPSWLGLVLAPERALGWLVWLNAVWGAAGAAHLAGVFGAKAFARAAVALGFGLGAPLLGLTSLLTQFSSFAWFPWTIALGLGALAVGSAVRMTLAAVALALQLLAGEPFAVLLSIVAIALLAFPTALADRRVGQAIRRGATFGCLGLAIAAVQVLPTLLRLADSPRVGGAAAEEALRWSLPPVRLVELVLPRFHGDPNRDELGLYLGWGVNDRNYPYLPALSLGITLSAFALAGFSAATRWRPGLLALAATGVMLSLGRHNPLYLLLREVPPLSWMRYPEKWLFLTLLAIVGAAAIGMSRWYERGEHRAAWAALGLGLASVTWWVWLGGEGAADWIHQRAGSLVDGEAFATLRGWLRSEALVSVGLGIVVAAAVRLGSLWAPHRRLAALLIAACIVIEPARDLDSVLPVVPRDLVLAEPPVVTQLDRGSRVLTTLPYDGEVDIGVRFGPPIAQQLIGRVRRLDPYAGLLFGLSYSFHPDYDLMRTRWATFAQNQFESEWKVSRDRAHRLAGAWNTATVVWRRSPEELAAEARATRRWPELVRAEPNVFAAPEIRAARRVRSHGSLDVAAEEARASSWDPVTVDLVASSSRGTRDLDEPTMLTADVRSDRLDLRWSSAAPALVLIARTYDPRWTARLPSGRTLPLVPTALGQIAVELPAHPSDQPGELELAFRDRSVPVGLAITLLALLACGAWILVEHRVVEHRVVEHRV